MSEHIEIIQLRLMDIREIFQQELLDEKPVDSIEDELSALKKELEDDAKKRDSEEDDDEDEDRIELTGTIDCGFRNDENLHWRSDNLLVQQTMEAMEECIRKYGIRKVFDLLNRR